jgi:hypothetical protein
LLKRGLEKHLLASIGGRRESEMVGHRKGVKTARESGRVFGLDLLGPPPFLW